MSKTIWFDDVRPNTIIKAYSEEQINKIKADAVRDAMKSISNSFDWDWSHVSSYEYCELLTEYAGKLEKNK